MNWLAKAFDFFKHAARLEGMTLPGLINMAVVVLFTVGIFTVGSIEALQGLVRAIRGEDGPGFPPVFIVVTDVFLLVFCVSILIVADRLRSSKS